MPDPAESAEALELCLGSDLAERGTAFVWDVLLWREPVRAFALRFEGVPVAYINRCAHVPTEMDWQYGEFLDGDREWIMCSIHGAVYDPRTGHCVGGPCVNGRLMSIPVVEKGDKVYWYPSRDIRPAFD